jgi:hypothetical protein
VHARARANSGVQRRYSFALACSFPPLLAAQQPASDTVAPKPPVSAAANPLEFSGVLFANYQYRGDAGVSKSANKFDVERVYLTFRMLTGERASIRVTTDVFQQTDTANDSFYKGWVVRVKYAYFQYDFLKRSNFTGVARAGLVHTVAIDHLETFWPRWISPTAVDRAAFFSSADAGLATLFTLPSKWGEVYLTVVNGPGYTARETDRFKDYAARLTLTPLSSVSNAVLRTLALTGWTYQGAVASRFAAGGAGQLGALGYSLPRTRSGVFLGLRDPRLSAGVEYDIRRDGSEAGDNTALSRAVKVDSTGRLAAAFLMVKPFLMLNRESRLPLGIVARWDSYKPNIAVDRTVQFAIAGITWDLTRKASVSLDYQEQSPRGSVTGTSASKTYFLHLLASF